MSVVVSALSVLNSVARGHDGSQFTRFSSPFVFLDLHFIPTRKVNKSHLIDIRIVYNIFIYYYEVKWRNDLEIDHAICCQTGIHSHTAD